MVEYIERARYSRNSIINLYTEYFEILIEKFSILVETPIAPKYAKLPRCWEEICRQYDIVFYAHEI